MVPSSCLSASETAFHLAWVAGLLPDTSEALVPAGADPFAVAKCLRESDPSAAYAVDERDGGICVIVAMPDEPPVDPTPEPAQTSEPNVFRTLVTVVARVAPMLKAEYFLYGPTVAYLERLCRKLALVAMRAINVTHAPITPVDYGPDDDGSSGGWENDGSGEVASVNAIGTIVKHLRRIYPKDVPDNAELARDLAAAFREDEANG